MADITVRDADLSNASDFERLYRATRLAALASHVKAPSRSGLQQDLDNGDRELLIEGNVKPDKQEEIKLKYNVHPGRAPWIDATLKSR